MVLAICIAPTYWDMDIYDSAHYLLLVRQREYTTAKLDRMVDGRIELVATKAMFSALF